VLLEAKSLQSVLRRYDGDLPLQSPTTYVSSLGDEPPLGLGTTGGLGPSGHVASPGGTSDPLNKRDDHNVVQHLTTKATSICVYSPVYQQGGSRGTAWATCPKRPQRLGVASRAQDACIGQPMIMAPKGRPNLPFPKHDSSSPSTRQAQRWWHSTNQNTAHIVGILNAIGKIDLSLFPMARTSFLTSRNHLRNHSFVDSFVEVMASDGAILHNTNGSIYSTE